MNDKPIIYQLIPRLFTNYNNNCCHSGTIEQNGSGKLADINQAILCSIADMGFSHVWLTGVIEHSHCSDYTAYGIPRDNCHVIKGQAGSPYAITDYYDIDPDLAVSVPERMKEFEATVKRIHKAGLKVIIDFVPNHVAREYRSDVRLADAPSDFGTGDYTTLFFAPTNSFYYIPGHEFTPTVDMGSGDDAYREFPAKASGNDCFTASPGTYDWYDTVKLNYGIDPTSGWRHFNPVPPTWHRMLHILMYWAGKGVDGFRCDMVHMVPVEFWQWAVPQVKAKYPGVIFIAEIYDVNLYRPYIEIGGFDYLYDKVGLYDTLRAIVTGNGSASDITRAWQHVDGYQHNMLYFLENHDEQRFASPQFAGDARKAVAPMVVSAMLGPGAVMVYFGQEIGEPGTDAEGYSGRDGRTTIFDYWSLDTMRRWLNEGRPSEKNLTPDERSLRAVYKKILGIAGTEKAVRDGSFFDLMYVNTEANEKFDPRRQYAFLRHLGVETLLVVANFSDSPVVASVNIPEHAFDYFNMPQGSYHAEELLSGTKKEADFSAAAPFETPIPAHGAAVWKLTR